MTVLILLKKFKCSNRTALSVVMNRREGTLFALSISNKEFCSISKHTKESLEPPGIMVLIAEAKSGWPTVGFLVLACIYIHTFVHLSSH